MIKVAAREQLENGIAALHKAAAAGWIDGRPIELIWRPWRDARSTSQNALYRIWCRHIADVTGNDEDDVHDMMRWKFLGHEPIGLGIETGQRLRSTTRLTKQEMSEYMGKIEAWAADIGIMLPMPEDNEYMTYREAAQ